jgi:rhodanese-related sulfurtransferase
MEATRVTVDEVSQRMDRGELFTFVDTRNLKAWAEADTRLPAAIRIPADEVQKHIADIPRDRVVITYCTEPHEVASARVAQELMEQGFKNVHPLFGGFEAWEKAALPVEPNSGESREASSSA